MRHSLGATLELVKEVQDELGERHVKAHLDRFAREMDHVSCNAAVLDSELHDGTRILGRADNFGLEVRLLNALDARSLGQILRAANINHLAVSLVE